MKELHLIENEPYFVAEIGLNWNGDMDLCYNTILAAHNAGANAVKFQNYKTESFIGQRSEFWEYKDHKTGKIVRERQYDMFKRHELNPASLMAIDNMCEIIGIDWHSTPMCKEGVNDLIVLDVPVLKNGSDCLQDLELIKYMAGFGRWVVISTGMAKTSEIAAAVEAYRSASPHADKLILLHCTSAYPAADEDMNLARIGTLKLAFGCEVGLSDHSQGVAAAVLAGGMQVPWYEAHFTLDKTLPGPDHWFSKSPDEFTAIVSESKRAAKMMGDFSLGMTRTEKENREKWFKNG